MTHPKSWTFILVAATAGFGLARATVGQVPDPLAPRAPAALRVEEPPYRGLDATLYMQTSAEYRACCLQAYNLATLRLRQAVAAGKPREKLAVIMDLDETVLDNGGFQAMQVRSNIAFDQRLWDIWEEKNGNLVGLIPGAKDFILEANKLGVTVVYMSNRSDSFKAQTKAMLARLGIPAQDDLHIKLATAATGSNKTSRRQEVEKDYTVVLLIGDNLRDFDEQFRCGNLGGKTSAELEAVIRERKDKVDAQRAAWGDRWIILPNPAYGEWTKPLGLGKRDLDRLVPQVEIAP